MTALCERKLLALRLLKERGGDRHGQVMLLTSSVTKTQLVADGLIERVGDAWDSCALWKLTPAGVEAIERCGSSS